MQLRRFVMRFVVVAGLAVAGGLLIVAILNYRATRRLQAHLEAIRAAGEPATLAELVEKPLGPEDNAAVQLVELRTEIEDIQRELQPLYHAEDDQNLYYDGKNLTDAGAKLVRGVFERHPKPLEQLVTSAATLHYQTLLNLHEPPPEIIEEQLKQVQLARAAMRLLQWRAALHRFDGQCNEAAKLGVVALEWTENFDSEPFIVSYLVSLAIRSVALSMIEDAMIAGPLEPAVRSTINEQLARHDPMSGWKQVLLSERIFGIAQFREMVPAPVASMWWFKNDQCEYLELMNGHLQAATLPAYQSADQLKALHQQVPESARLTRLIMTSLDAGRNANDRVRAQLRCLRAANRLQAIAAQQDQVPQSLADLNLPEDAITDPFTGKPLLVKKTEGHWIIYSVGVNGQDDSGTLELVKDVGVGPIPLKFEQ